MTPAAAPPRQQREEIFHRLAVTFCDLAIYSLRHPRFVASCRSFVDVLKTHFDSHPNERHVLFVHRRGQIYFKRVPLPVLTPTAIKLVRHLAAREVEGLRFDRSLQSDGFAAFIEALSSIPSSDADAAEGECFTDVFNRRLAADGLLAQAGLFSDRELTDLESSGGVLTTERDEALAERGLIALPELRLPLACYQATLIALHDLMGQLSTGRSPSLDPVLGAAAEIIGGIRQAEESFLHMAHLQYADDYTFHHSVNVCLLATRALKPYVRNPDRLRDAGIAALLHDLGKCLVASEVFYTREVPDAHARDEIRRHPPLAAEVLLDYEAAPSICAVVAHDHHRRPDGSGYPQCRIRRDIDLITQVVSAADIFEALTADRPYKRSLSPSEAFEVSLKLPESKGIERGLRLLLDALSPFPPGSFVKLDTGDLAIVVRANEGRPVSPVVRLVLPEGDGWRVDHEELDLAASLPGPSVPRIAGPASSPWNVARDEEPEDLRSRVEAGDLLASEG